MANSRAINHGPETLKGTAFSGGVFFGFSRRTSRIIVKNKDATNDLLYHFQPASADAVFSTLEQGGADVEVVDSVMGIHVKGNAAQTVLFEALGTFDYLT